MFRKLLPRQDDFFELFETHAKMIVKAAEGLLAFADPTQDPQSAYHYIKACEEEADSLTYRCISLLHTNFITPFDRSDIHLLIQTMDDVIDEINTVGKFIVLYKLKHLDHESLTNTYLLIKAAKLIENSLQVLKKRKEFMHVRTHIMKIKEIEHEADQIYMQALAKLFDDNKDPLTVIKWKEVYEHLEKALNACDDVGNIIEGIILENE